MVNVQSHVCCMQGFREQTQHWPVQPLDLVITWLQKQSPDWVVADFGCGDARLGSSVPQKVHGLDLVAAAPGVTACNMAHTPLGQLLLSWVPWSLPADCVPVTQSTLLLTHQEASVLQEAFALVCVGY